MSSKSISVECRVGAAAALCIAWGLGAPVATPAPAPAPEPISLTVGNSAVIDYPTEIGRVSISNPDVVDAVAVTSRELLLNGKAGGTSAVVVWSRAGERRFFSVAVDPDLEPIRRLVRETFPGESIDVRATRDSLSLVGNATSQPVADRALELMKPFAKAVVNNLRIMPPGPERQIVLHVKFAELDRSAGTSLGFNLISTGAAGTPGRVTTGQFSSAGPTDLKGVIGAPKTGASTDFSLSDVLNIFAFRPDLNLAATIKALQTQGLLQILAEPNLVTSDGKEATLLVGGEIPVPMVQGGASVGAVTIQYREFGIRLTFLPAITPHQTIRLHVRPEVSTLDAANAITLSGFTIPALASRRVETNIELGPGQSFVIAGLIDDRVQENLSKIPGLAHIPLLGVLFKSRLVNKSKSELVVLVTPEIAPPLPPGQTPRLPILPEKFLNPVAAGAPRKSSPEK